MRRSSVLVALAAVAGPGLLAGLSDDDPAGIATYSILGADYGYELLWVLLLSTVALVIFHEAAARMGVATGQGLMGLIRERYGVRLAGGALIALLVANIGTTCAEFAGVAASLELAGVSKYISVPIAAAGVSFLVLRGGFHRVEHVLLALGTVFAAYIAAGFLAQPDWGAAAKGLVVPSMPSGTAALLAVTATVGTTLAPWGLAFLQSYVVDKRLRPKDLKLERVDVITGAVMTGVIGLFIVVACAATLHADGRSIESASDAAAALKPLAGNLAATLFGAGLLGAALLAASILPLSTAYSVAETAGTESALDDPLPKAKLFYGTYAAVVVVAVAIVLIPGAPLIRILFLSQALNAILLLPILVFIIGITRDREMMGDLATGRRGNVLAVGALVLIAACVLTLFASQLSGG
jgi:NRAMP (natural resistance-associated macrophage protein)-like metal ion transporter